MRPLVWTYICVALVGLYVGVTADGDAAMLAMIVSIAGAMASWNGAKSSSGDSEMSLLGVCAACAIFAATILCGACGNAMFSDSDDVQAGPSHHRYNPRP